MNNQFRVGQGYDAHKLVLGRPLVLGGVLIPYGYGLDGHSDADVLVHAIMDALLGAAALGDIGKSFPDSNPAFKDISSLLLLAQVVDALHSSGFSIGNIDSTIIAQAPKVQPYVDIMRLNIAKTCSISIDRVNVKATTEEKMGFTGRKEGISAQAIALIFENE